MRRTGRLEKLGDESGLTLIELLAGLMLFGLVITMVNGVFLTAISLKKEVTSDVTIRNHADALVNTIVSSMTNTYKSEDVMDLIMGSAIPKNGLEKTAALNKAYLSAIWTRKKQPDDPANPWVYYLYSLVPVDEKHNTPPYKLIRETFKTPTNKTTLLFTETKYFTSYSPGIDDWRAPVETIQLNDTNFPLLDKSSITVETNENGDSSLLLNLIMGQNANASVHYQITSRLHIE